ncbi:MAG: hypothetical protein LCH61_11320, partial [Proteobacteria bacterium]|nr:hypothetical protein [Pseudomonadota bacterium]
MNFDLTDEQRLLQDSIGKLLADTYSFEQRRRYQVTPMGRDPSVWQVFAETGLAARVQWHLCKVAHHGRAGRGNLQAGSGAAVVARR